MKNLLLQIYQLPLAAQKQALENELNNWKKHTEQIDDILFIGFQTVVSQ